MEQRDPGPLGEGARKWCVGVPLMGAMGFVAGAIAGPLAPTMIAAYAGSRVDRQASPESDPDKPSIGLAAASGMFAGAAGTAALAAASPAMFVGLIAAGGVAGFAGVVAWNAKDTALGRSAEQGLSRLRERIGAWRGQQSEPSAKAESAPGL